MATVAKNSRTNEITLGSSGAGPYSVGFRLFDDDAIDVFVDGVEVSTYTLSATYTDGYSDTATITFDTSQDAGAVIRIEANLTPDRAEDYSVSGPDFIPKLDIELGRIWSAIADLHRDAQRAPRLLQDEAFQPVNPTANAVLKISAAGTSVEAGPTTTEITNAESNATAAAASATAAAASATAAAAAENSLLEWQGAWITATAYAPSDLVEENGNTYVCVVAHTSGTFATDLTANRWELFAAKGATGAGSGDLVAANNLSDVANAASARSNLGLGSAAVLTAGTGANNAVQLDGSSRLPAVDGSQLTGLDTVIFTESYVSSAVTLTAGGTATAAHGLATSPLLVQPYLNCISADQGYAVGDNLLISPGEQYLGAGISLIYDSTNVSVRFGSTIRVLNKSTGAAVSIDFTKWRFYVRAFA